jgi:hypothetical protein
MLPGHFQGLALEDRIEESAVSKGIPGLRLPVLAFRAHPVNRGAELLDEGLDGLRMQRKAPFEMHFQLGFGRPSPMAPTAEPVNLDQACPQVSRRPASLGRLVPLRLGQGHLLGEDRRFLHEATL